MRFAAGVEYCGSGYAGWQRQKHARTVQGEVEKALSQVADHPLLTVCAGRTDAGVHALGQVIHFDSESCRSSRGWCFGANSNLPADISLQWVCPVAAEFSARYSAQARYYRYLILDSSTRSGLFADQVCWSRHPLDEKRMHMAAQKLLGEHDFSSFRARECQSNSPVREVQSIQVSRQGQMVILDIQANAFVHHMVRNIAGALMSIGRGKRSAGWIDDLLAVKDREQSGITASASGLYLMHVLYPSEIGLPSSNMQIPLLSLKA